MPTCHHCPHAADVAAGKYSDKPFQAVPCFRCTLGNDEGRRGGQTSLDAATGALDGQLSERWREETPAALIAPEPDPADPPAQLIDFLATWLRQSPLRRDLIAWRLVNPRAQLVEFARESGRSPQVVHSHWKRLERDFPWLARGIRHNAQYVPLGQPGCPARRPVAQAPGP